MAQRKLEKTPEENRKTVDLVSRLESSFDVEDGETSVTSGF